MSRSERGAAAVEFALVLPLLVALLAGIAEFGRAYYIQTTLSAAAREGVRAVALNQGSATAQTAAARLAARSAASSLTLTDGQIIVLQTCPLTTTATTSTTATSTPNAKVRVTYVTPFMSGMFGTALNLKGEGVMRCGG